MKYICFKAVDITELTEKLNTYIQSGGKIQSLSMCVDNGMAYVLALVSEK